MQAICFVIRIVIVLNSFTIGMQSSGEVHGEDVSFLTTLEYFFLIIYTAELVFRFLVYGKRCLRNAWVRFDAFIVVTSLLTAFVLEPMLAGAGTGESNDAATAGIGSLVMLRIARLAKLASTHFF